MEMKALYPGTFDPLTNGHLDIIKRSSKLFSHLVVAVAKNSSKKPFFSMETREWMIRETLRENHIKNATCKSFENLLADFAKQEEVQIIIRGLRVVSDFEYEIQMSYANSSLNPNLEMVYFMPSLKNAFISSSMVRNILEHQGKISHLIPKSVLKIIQKGGNLCM